MNKEFLDKLEDSPIVAAIRNDEGLHACLQTDVEIVFVLYGDVCSISEITEQIAAAGKTPVVHLDLIDGLSQREAAVDFLQKKTAAQGIITTRSSLISCIKEKGMAAVLRIFILDSRAMDTVGKLTRQSYASQPDVIEVLPGTLAPKVIKNIRKKADLPLICGGLISDREDVMNALNNGAIAVSATNPSIWAML
ncbi:MAG: glycerol-3-phosphate responsive antiterminator [Bilifractor sp.]